MTMRIPASSQTSGFRGTLRDVRAAGKALVFFLKVFPMLPSRPIDWITPRPVVEKVVYPSCNGQVEGEIYRSSRPGKRPGILVCLGVVPFGADHPQVPVLGKALARAGFAALRPEEAELLRAAFADGRGALDGAALSEEGRAVLAVLSAQDAAEAMRALDALPAGLQARLTAMSPATHVDEIHAPLFVHLHDIGDLVIPVGESRDLQARMAGRPGVQYTEMGFQHLDPVKGKLPLGKLVRELSKFFRAVVPLFRAVA